MATAIETRIPIIETTIRISISVNPRRASPLRVGRSIGGLIHAGSVDIEHILTAPGGGFGLVLHTAFSPVASVGHRVERNAAEEFYLLVDLVRDLHAIDEY